MTLGLGLIGVILAKNKRFSPKKEAIYVHEPNPEQSLSYFHVGI